MLERRNSDRIALAKVHVRELNGDYMYSFEARNLSEEGIFLGQRFCNSQQEPYSQLTFTLPNGTHFRNLTARIVREQRTGPLKGCSYEFMNLSEGDRIELKKFFVEYLKRGTA